MSSQAYTPGLKRKEIFVVKKTRKLPIPGEVLVTKGDVVSQDTIVARTSVQGEPHVVKVANDLDLNPDTEKTTPYMLRKLGDTVRKGEPIAIYKALLGLVKKVSLSPTDGTVEHISDLTGQVIVRGPPIPVEVKAYMPGRVVEVVPNEGVVIQTTAALIQGIFGIGGETHGELRVLSNTPDDILEPKQIASEHRGKILVAGSLVTKDALAMAVKVGASGIVVGGIMDKDLIDFLGYEIGVAITGQEEKGLTLILTEGFGKIRMLERTFQLLKRFEGKLVCMNGATQIRAGVVRPEIVIPREDLSSTELVEVSGKASSSEMSAHDLKLGTPIRLIQKPHFGALGKVTGLPVELRRMKTESSVKVLEVELIDDGKIIVPRANVEIIEE